MWVLAGDDLEVVLRLLVLDSLFPGGLERPEEINFGTSCVGNLYHSFLILPDRWKEKVFIFISLILNPVVL